MACPAILNVWLGVVDKPHPLGVLLRDAARGVFPPADGSVRVVGPPPGSADAVVAFTAHHVIAADVSPDAVLERLAPGELGAPMNARFLAWLADSLGSAPGSLDVVLTAFGIAGGEPAVELVRRDTLANHPRVARAIRYRDDLAVYADREERGVVIVGRGLARRWEVSLELDPAYRGIGLGRSLAEAVRELVSADEVLFAQVAPGNAASLRAFLAAGFRPIGAEVLFPRPRK